MKQGLPEFWPYDLHLGAWPTFWKLLALLRTFELWVLAFIHFIWIFLVAKPFRGYQHFLFCDLDPGVLLIFFNIYLSNNFWTVNTRALIFNMNIFFETKPSRILTLWPLPWSLTYFLKTFSLVKNFWTVSARALIFHMNIPCDKIFLLVLNLFTLTFDQFIDIGHKFFKK